jgi:cytidylate kinase
MGRSGPVIAIDGPSGAGKSTLANALAIRLGVEALDTGAMYRAVAWAALDRGIDPHDAEAVAALARSVNIGIDDALQVDGREVTDAIRSGEVDSVVSVVAANPAVREEMVRRQREWLSVRGAGVIEGRDIANVVAPDADLKVYLTASSTVRADRRASQLGMPGDTALVEEQMSLRDRVDSTRAVSPLAPPGATAPGAIVIDSTGKGPDEVVEEVMAWL